MLYLLESGYGFNEQAPNNWSVEFQNQVRERVGGRDGVVHMMECSCYIINNANNAKYPSHWLIIIIRINA